ncbi:MAG: sulfide:quinone oxidoreductase [Acidimicrobiaceae bacterium]
MPTHVVILGAGFGGLELSTRLSEELADEVQVTLIDKNDSFIFGFSKLDVMFGRRTLDEVRLHYRDFSKRNVTFRQETIVSIDPDTRRVVTDKSTYDADILVVALGADYDPAATPGLLEGGYEFYSHEGANQVRDVLPSFDSGVAVIGVLGGFFKCPPAPIEAALMLHNSLTARGVRDAVTIYLISPLPMPVPISKPVSDEIVAMLEDRGIEYWPGSLVTRLDPSGKVAHLNDGRELAYDLFLGIPVHCAPPVVVESGLTDDGWIAVDTATFATRFPDIYAVGDITNTPVPRAGAMAEGEAGTLADVLISQLKDGRSPAPFVGKAICYLESGDDEIAMVDVNFLGGPAPTAVFRVPSDEGAEMKRQFGATRRARWFGQ